MPATHSTPVSATAKGQQPAATSHAPAAPKAVPTKAVPTKGKSAKKAPSKASAKAPVKAVAKAPVKAVATPKSSGSKTGKAADAPSKAGKVAAKSTKPAPSAGKAAAPKPAADAKTDSKIAKKVEPAQSPSASHAKDQPKKPVGSVAVEHSAPKNDKPLSKPLSKQEPKPEPKRERAPEDSHKKLPVRRSSLVDFPVPPPPVRPPFVPPKPVAAPSEEVAPVGVNASHSAALIQKQRQRLLDLRDDLVDALSGMTRDTIRNAPEGSEASGSGMHQGDAGSDAYDRDFALSVLAKEQDALYEIDQALRRIQKGIYGVCEMSNRKIPQARLEAIPFARLTVECQSQWEKEYGNRRFRPSNEVGFSGGNLVEDEDSETVLLDEDED